MEDVSVKQERNLNLGDLEFKAENFASAATDIEQHFISGEHAAIIANRLLKERLGKAQQVWGKLEDDFGVMVYFDDEEAPYKPTHTCRIVCIEALPK